MDPTVKELIALGRDVLHASGYECFETDAGTLMEHVLGMDRSGLFLSRDDSVDDEHHAYYMTLLDRVVAGEPLQYATGEAYFMGHRFAVNPAVLIPRPETELLCEMAIKELQSFDGKPAVLDLCTGSGAIAVSIALAVESAKLTASDISEAALTTAQSNANALGVLPNILFLKSDLFNELPGGPYDMIVTNPPYIRTADIAGLPTEVRKHEPAGALNGGADGLDFYYKIAKESGAFLVTGGILLAEIGCDQGQQVKAAFEAAGFSEVSISKDYAGRDRIAKAINK